MENKVSMWMHGPLWTHKSNSCLHPFEKGQPIASLRHKHFYYIERFTCRTTRLVFLVDRFDVGIIFSLIN